MMEWLQLSNMYPNNFYAYDLGFFHEYVMVIMSFIMIKIIYFLVIVSYGWKRRSVAVDLLEDDNLEVVWTILPFVLVLVMLIPSLFILAMYESISYGSLLLKITGYQWYWVYNMNQMLVELGASIKDSNDSSVVFRLLEANNSLILPYLMNITVLITSADVIHSWTIPSLAVKMDAIPGRLNEFNLMSNKPGKFYGQCSEICGINHSFMPINVEFTSLDWWISRMLSIRVL